MRIFKLHNGTGTINVRLDKFPGTAVPLGQLTTRPRATECTATPTRPARRKASVHGQRARQLSRITAQRHGVLAVGGLLAPSPAAAARSADLPAPTPSSATKSHTVASIAAVKPCSSPRTLSAVLRVFLVNLYPPAVYVEPTSAWAWSYSRIFGTVTNWQFRGSITAMWSWNCYQVD